MFKRKPLITIALASLLVLFGATIAMAYPNHTSLAWVDPGYDPDTWGGQAQYHVQITDSNASFIGVDEVVIEFENDIFATWSVASSVPAGWTWAFDPGTSSSTFTIGTTDPGGALVVGGYVDVWIDYTLQASVEDLEGLWNEGHAWHQSVTTWEIDHAGSHGTSTEPIPEPTTAMLFGSGMMLIGYLRRRD